MNAVLGSSSHSETKDGEALRDADVHLLYDTPWLGGHIGPKLDVITTLDRNSAASS